MADPPPPIGFVARAWGILRAVTRGKELFPDKVGEWMQDSLKKFVGQIGSDIPDGEVGDQVDERKIMHQVLLVRRRTWRWRHITQAFPSPVIGGGREIRA